MFKKNKRRDKSTFLDMENGEVKTSEVNIVKNLNIRKFDEEIGPEDLFKEEKTYNTLNSEEYVLYDSSKDMNNDEDIVVQDMQITMFNIFKFIFAFCIVAVIAYLGFKVIPIVSKDINLSSSSSESVIVEDVEKFDDDVNIAENIQKEKVKEELKVVMQDMNTINNEIKTHYLYLNNYCTGYSENRYTIYAHKKNINNLNTTISNAYLTLLNNESNFKTEYEKQLFEIYKSRYDNLVLAIETLSDENNYNRRTIIEVLNSYISSDNTLNQEEFDILIEIFNENGLSYTIADNEIILND